MKPEIIAVILILIMINVHSYSIYKLSQRPARAETIAIDRNEQRIEEAREKFKE